MPSSCACSGHPVLGVFSSAGDFACFGSSLFLSSRINSDPRVYLLRSMYSVKEPTCYRWMLVMAIPERSSDSHVHSCRAPTAPPASCQPWYHSLHAKNFIPGFTLQALVADTSRIGGNWSAKRKWRAPAWRWRCSRGIQCRAGRTIRTCRTWLPAANATRSREMASRSFSKNQDASGHN